MSPSQRARIERYESAYVDEYGYEAWLVQGRRCATLEAARLKRPARVVEIGCGIDLLALEALPALPRCERWVIVEPSEGFAELASRVSEVWPTVTVVRGFFEAAIAEVRAALGGEADLVILDGLLHELPDPDGMLRAAAGLLAPDGWIHVSVPNARSIHRRLAVAMGIIDDVHALSARNERLEQRRVYDASSLEAALASAGLTVERRGGHTAMPFSSAQMEAIEPTLGDDVFRGLSRLGEEIPELAAEIYVDARRTTSGSMAE